MTTKTNTHIQDTDFIYQNTPVRTIINRNHPQTKLPGLTIGPYEQGKEYQIPHWIATELEQAGIARIREEEQLNIKQLDKTLWKEKLQQTRQLTHLEENFYPRLRRLLQNTKKTANHNPEKMTEYKKTTAVAHDIINVRLRKITYLASSPEQTNQTLNDLAKEERHLYNHLTTTIKDWKNKILKATNEP